MNQVCQLFIESVCDVLSRSELQNLESVPRWSRAVQQTLNGRSSWILVLVIKDGKLYATMENLNKRKHSMFLEEFLKTDPRFYRIYGLVMGAYERLDELDFEWNDGSWSVVETQKNAQNLVKQFMARLDYTACLLLSLVIHAKTRIHEIFIDEIRGHVHFQCLHLPYFHEKCFSFAKEQISSGKLRVLTMSGPWPKEMLEELKGFLES